MWAYPWYTSVRKTLEDPAYADWYLRFKDKGPWYSKKCDAVNNTDCSDFYHCREQSPGFPHGDGDCGAPNCYCGSNVPCGFYIWVRNAFTSNLPLLVICRPFLTDCSWFLNLV